MNVYHKREFVAQIYRQSRGADNFQATLPWLLLLTDGRIRRFASQVEAKDEALKRWAPCTFKRGE